MFSALIAACHGQEPLSVNVRDPLTGIERGVELAGRGGTAGVTGGTSNTTTTTARPPIGMPRPAGQGGEVAGVRAVAGNAGFSVPPSGRPGVCGDGLVEFPEACDSDNLDGATCQTLGYTSGFLVCNPSTCNFDTIACRFTTMPPPENPAPIDAGLDDDAGLDTQGI